MPTDPGGSLPAPPEPDPLAIPATLLADLTAEAKDGTKSAVKRLQTAIGHNARSTKSRLYGQSLIALRQAGHSPKQIAELLDMEPNAVRVALWRARKAGELNDLRDLLAHDTTALAIDAVNSAISKRDKKGKYADVAVKHLEGLGYYKNHSQVKTDGAVGGMTALQVNVVVQQSTPEAPITAQAFDVSEACVGVARID